MALQIHSMTGYGSSIIEVGGVDYSVEAKSLNSRHTDVRVKLPWSEPLLEARLVDQARGSILRGRLEVVIRHSPAADTAADPAREAGAAGGAAAVDRALVQRLEQAHAELSQLAGILGMDERPGIRDVVAYVGAMGTGSGPRQAPAGFSGAVAGALAEAMAGLSQMRAQEGAAMAAALQEQLASVEALVSEVADLVQEQPALLGARYRRRVEALLREMGSEGALDEDRLIAEIAAIAERADVTEELVRLRSHVVQFRQILSGSRPHGRRLEFLLQEMNREINTASSKSQDARIGARVVEVKAQIERLREIVLNIE